MSSFSALAMYVCNMWWSPEDEKTSETINRASGGVKRIFHENVLIISHWRLIQKERPIAFHLERMPVVLNWGCGLLINTCARRGGHMGESMSTSGACIDVEIKRSLILGVARGVPSLSRPPRNTCNFFRLPPITNLILWSSPLYCNLKFCGASDSTSWSPSSSSSTRS